MGMGMPDGSERAGNRLAHLDRSILWRRAYAAMGSSPMRIAV